MLIAIGLAILCNYERDVTVVNVPEALKSKSAGQLAEELAGFPSGTLEAVEAFRDSGTEAALSDALLLVLEHFMPAKSRRPLVGTRMETRVQEELGIDSLSMTEAIFAMEGLFGFTADFSELAKVETIGGVMDYLMERFIDA